MWSRRWGSCFGGGLNGCRWGSWGEACHCDEDRWWGCIAVNEWVSPPSRQTQACRRWGGGGGKGGWEMHGNCPRCWNLERLLSNSFEFSPEAGEENNPKQRHAVFQHLTHNLYQSFQRNRSVMSPLPNARTTKWCIYHTYQCSKRHSRGSIIYARTKALHPGAAEFFHTDPVPSRLFGILITKPGEGDSLPCNSFWAKSKRFSLKYFLYPKPQSSGTIVLVCHAICRLIIDTQTQGQTHTHTHT